jgi:CheY-like chemotaxis protein
MQTTIEVDEFPVFNRYSGAEIFVIDDEQIVVDTLTHYLQSAGFEKVSGFSDAAEAVTNMRLVSPDLIITDIRMPGMSGKRVTKIVRGFPQLSHVPVIAVTSDSRSETLDSIIQAGAESVLLKPVTRELLINRALHAIDEAIELEQSRYSSDEYADNSDHPTKSWPRKSANDKRWRRRRNRFR